MTSPANRQATPIFLLITAFIGLLLTVGANAAQITIEDADTVVEGDFEDVEMIFNVRLDEAVDHIVTVDYATIADTATPGEDYIAKSGTITFSPQQTFTSVVIVILGDIIGEDYETVRVRLSNPSGATIFIGEAVGSIADTDEVKVSVADGRALESSGTITTTVSLSLPTQFAIEADWRTVVNGQTTATPDADFIPATGTIRWEAGETEATIAVEVVPDNLSEGDEFFFVQLTSISHSGVTVERSFGRMTIADVSVPLFRVSDTTIAESDDGSPSSGSVTVTLTPASDETTQVRYATEDGTATAGSDYQAAGGVLTFSAGQTSATIPLTVFDDDIQGPKTFLVKLIVSTGNTSIATDTGVVTITDNDGGSLQFAFQQASVREGSTAVGLVSRNSTSGDLTVELSSSDPNEATVPAAMRIRDGSNTGTFSISGVVDGVRDGDVMVTVEASASGYPTVSDSILVEDNDAPRTVIYSLTFRGGAYAANSRSLSASGYLVVDLNAETAYTMLRYSNGDQAVDEWTANGVMYRTDIGPRDAWLLTYESATEASPGEVDSYRYLELLGIVYPDIPLGGRAVGFAAASLSGPVRAGAPQAGELTLGTLNARVLLPLTRSYNSTSTPYEDVLEELADALGVALPASSDDNAAPMASITGTGGPIGLYSLNLSGIKAGSNTVARFAYGGFLLVDHTTGEMTAYPLWRQGSVIRYGAVSLSVGDSFVYRLALGNGFGVIGSQSTPETNVHQTFHAYGSEVRHNLGSTTTTYRLPFRYSGMIWRHTLAGNGRGSYIRATLTAGIRAETITLVSEELDFAGAQSWVETNLLGSYQESTFEF